MGWCFWIVFVFVFVFVFFLSRLAANVTGAEGAGRLAEPLDKLTALRKLYLGSMV